MERRTVTPGFVSDALACLAEAEVSEAEILARAGLPEVINEPLTGSQFGRLWWTIAREIDDEFFGLTAQPMRPGSFALLCHAVLHTRNLDQALRRAILFLRVAVDEPHGTLHVENGEARIVLHDPSGARSAFAYRTYWLILMGVASWLVGRQIPLRRLEFSSPPPERIAEYSQFFDAPAKYDRPTTFLAFNATALRWPVVRTEKSVRSFLRHSPGNIVVRYRQEHGLILQIRERLAATPPDEWPGCEALSHSLNMSSATLRRRLAAEGQSIGEIKDEIRQVRAGRLLADNRLTISEIAAELGYSEPSAFHRAYRKWTGKTPRGNADRG